MGDTPYALVDGKLHTFAALSKQLDVWCAEFDEVRIAAHRLDAPEPGFRALERDDIDFIALPSGGGTGLQAKLGVVALLFRWLATLLPLMRRATAVHLRTPCNVTLVAIPLARLVARRRYAIYAGSWEPGNDEPSTYRMQRAMLRRWGGVVHAYAPARADLPANVRPNVSPSFTDAELDELAPLAERRIARLTGDPMADRALRVCCVGAFSVRKNQAGLLRALKLIADRGVAVEARFGGTGRTEAADRALATELGLDDRVVFEGQLDPHQVRDLFDWADVHALVTVGEGFGKVFLEAMAVGCPSVVGNGPMQRAMVGDGERGRQADPSDPSSIADSLDALRGLDLAEQEAVVRACTAYARTCTLDAFADEVRHIIHDLLSVPPPTARATADT